MADVINLRHARKQKAKAEKERVAAENRSHFGQSGRDKRVREAEKALADRRLDQHKLGSEEEST